MENYQSTKNPQREMRVYRLLGFGHNPEVRMERRLKHVAAFPAQDQPSYLGDLFGFSNISELIASPRKSNLAFAADILAISSMSSWNIDDLDSVASDFTNRASRLSVHCLFQGAPAHRTVRPSDKGMAYSAINPL